MWEQIYTLGMCTQKIVFVARVPAPGRSVKVDGKPPKKAIFQPWGVLYCEVLETQYLGRRTPTNSYSISQNQKNVLARGSIFDDYYIIHFWEKMHIYGHFRLQSSIIR